MSIKPSSRQTSRYGRLGIILVIVGTLLAIDTWANLGLLYKFWPLLLILPGIGFIGIFLHRSRREAVYLGLGIYLLCFSGLALYCNLTSWSSLSLLWPLFLTFLGISFSAGYFMGKRNPILFLTGLLLLSMSGVFFFVFEVSRRLWWSAFILAGISFLIFNRMNQAT